MANMGKSRHMKRIAAPRSMKILRKTSKYVVKQSPGRHPISFSIPLLVLVRDYLGLATTAKEAKKIIKSGEVLIDGKPMKDFKFGVGLFDIVSIPKQNIYKKVIINNRGELVLADISPSEADKKICKIKNKYYYKGKLMVTLHDGRNVPASPEYKIGDSVILNLKENKVEKHLPFKENAKALVLGGQFINNVVLIRKIVPGSATTVTNAIVELNGEERLIPLKSLFIIG